MSRQGIRHVRRDGSQTEKRECRRTPLSFRYGADNAPTDAGRTSEADTLKGAGQPGLTARRASAAIKGRRGGAADTVSDQTNRGG